jgi:hypothetical protein
MQSDLTVTCFCFIIVFTILKSPHIKKLDHSKSKNRTSPLFKSSIVKIYLHKNGIADIENVPFVNKLIVVIKYKNDREFSEWMYGVIKGIFDERILLHICID